MREKLNRRLRDEAGRPRAFWNALSLACPFVGFAVASVALPVHDMSYGIGAIAPLVFGVGGGSVAGLAAASAAAWRGEPKWGLTAAAFAINLPLALLFVLIMK